MGGVERVKAACQRLRSERGAWNLPASEERFLRLAALVIKKAGAIVEPVAEVLFEAASAISQPWLLLEKLIAAPNVRVASSALELSASMAEAGTLRIDLPLVSNLAALVDSAAPPLLEPAALGRIARVLKCLPPSAAEGRGALPDLYVGATDVQVRRLAARLLDLSATLPSPEMADRVLGEEAARFLMPYLAFTRATHADLVDLVPDSGGPPPSLASIRAAEEICGPALLRDILSELGWRRLSAGLLVMPFAGLSAGGSFPLLLTPSEATLFSDEPQVRQVFERWLVVAHGGALGQAGASVASQDPVNRFRALNLQHADALGDFLDVAPLTVEKARRIVGRMDQIVDNFCVLFSEKEPVECGVVSSVYNGLKTHVEKEIASLVPGRPFSIELTRVIQMFEDPRTAGDVRTLHGLKRYLHQKGLKLGFRLAEAVRGTNRTVDLAVVTPQRVLYVARAIEYVDFEREPVSAGVPLGIPWPVWIAADGFARQVLHGQQNLPKLRAFCYGNEVHYFLAFRNHPVFLRVDYSPPLRGGMLDLEYYGVSKHELDSHPNISLDGIRGFFRRLDIEAEVDKTRIHARYDKERAVDLADLCGKVEAVFRLAPYLMDVDWVIGNLSLEPEARSAVAEAWAEFFTQWGVLPMAQFITSDRLGILAAAEVSATGPREVKWTGKPPYRDRFTTGPLPWFWEKVRSALLSRGISGLPPISDGQPVSQLALERSLLRPLRAAVSRGEVLEGRTGLAPGSPDLFERRHEAACFAELLDADTATVLHASQIARLASALEKHLRFQTTGSVNGYDVQRATLPLRGETVTLFVLRDGASVIRLAFYSLDGTPYRTREEASGPWRDNVLFDPEHFAEFLRRNNWPAAWLEPAAGSADSIASSLRAVFRTANPYEAGGHMPDERIVQGITAAPGHATGFACLGLSGRKPDDVEGAILVAASVRPEDSPLMFRAAGIVSTGGGVLSHAGLLAMQFNKPALVAGGTWEQAPGGAPTVACRRIEYDETVVQSGAFRVVERHHLRERDDCIHEGDILVVDADAGVLRLLGQDRDAHSLHDGIGQLVAASKRLSETGTDPEILLVRGRKLRARRQIEKVLSRMEDPVLARHAVRELLAGDAAATGGDSAGLLPILLGNPSTGKAAQSAMHQIAADLIRRHSAETEEASRLIPTSNDAQEILAERRDALKTRDRLEIAVSCLARCGITLERPAPQAQDLDDLAVTRLRALRNDLADKITNAASPGGRFRSLRHLLHHAERLDSVLEEWDGDSNPLDAMRRRIVEEDETARARLSHRRILLPADGGVELLPLVGSKAAALAEAAQLGEGSAIPRWFVVSDRAFRDVLEAPSPEAAAQNGLTSPGVTLETVIEKILARSDRDTATKSALIRRAWRATPLPPDLVEEITTAYQNLGETEDPFVAIRSSAREEDTEAAARAGEFDTFLFTSSSRGRGSGPSAPSITGRSWGSRRAPLAGAFSSSGWWMPGCQASCTRFTLPPTVRARS
jgi:phosphohistidine swiveling domain-containing protein